MRVRLPSAIWRSRMPAATLRAVLVLLSVLAPSLLIGGVSSSAVEISLVIGFIAGAFVLFEYGARNPGLIDFRFAPPYNRMRFALYTATLMLLVVFVRGAEGEGGFAERFHEVALRLGSRMDFPLSPVGMATEMLSRASLPAPDPGLRGAATIGLLTAGLGAALFTVMLLVFPWPRDREDFNIWINLPTFEPANPRDVERRLARLGVMVILSGLAAPFVILVLASSAAGLFDASALTQPLALIWSATLWSVGPALMVMRGVALLKIAWLVRIDG